MTPANLSLCQAILRQTNSIDETAELMASDYQQVNYGFTYWQREIIKEIEKGKLII